ncbi:interleukin-6 receptor subunit alpha [Leptodactylus fuscus]|uniref:interleukin-6 receptor subunit alpha n=1 Tax=Leptodactylus fuscus TaxID=238119 RepID=UPI003F4F2CBB
MGGITGWWSLFIILVSYGHPTTSYTPGTLCPKPELPDDAILVDLLSNVNLTCTGCEGRVSWLRRDPQGTPRPLNVTAGGHVVFYSVTYEDEDTYTCYKEQTPVCSVELIVRDEPQKDSSLFCYHQHPTHNITCKWRPRKVLHPKSTVTLIKVRVLEGATYYPCTYNSSEGTFTCSVFYNEGDSRRHVFYMCVSGRTDSELTANLEAYVKDLLHIGPPLSVRVTPVENHPRKLRVSWRPPEYWESPFYGLVYQILYGLEDSPHSSNVTTPDLSFIIDDAVMGMKHLIRVRAREEYQENWGSWSEEAAGVPWTDRTETTPVPYEYNTPKSEEDYDPEYEDKESEDLGRTFRYNWIAPGVSLVLVILFLFAIWIRYQEIKILKLKWGFLRPLLYPSSKVSTAQPPVSDSLLMSPSSSPSSVAITVSPLLEGE